MKYMDRFVRAAGITELAYHHPNWTRTNAPLLDHLGAEVDHVKAHSHGGAHEADNLATICHKCNLKKGALGAEDFRKKYPRREVNAKYGEPVQWDGLSTIFIALAKRDPNAVNSADRARLRALTARNAST